MTDTLRKAARELLSRCGAANLGSPAFWAAHDALRAALEADAQPAEGGGRVGKCSMCGTKALVPPDAKRPLVCLDCNTKDVTPAVTKSG
jgi:hypothetical protein